MAHLVLQTGTMDTLLICNGEERFLNCPHSDWTGMLDLYKWLSASLSKKQFKDLSFIFANGLPDSSGRYG